MKKMLLIFGFAIVLILGTLFIYFREKPKSKTEKTLTVLSYYGYLSKDKTTINLDLYTTKKESELLYAKNATISIYNDKVYFEPNFIAINLEGSAIYQEEIYYHYLLTIDIEIDFLYLEDATLKIAFSNKNYLFKIGDLEIIKNEDYKPLTVQMLQGMSYDKPYLSLAGISVRLFENVGVLASCYIGKPFIAYPTNGFKDETDIKNVVANYNYNYLADEFSIIKDKEFSIIIGYKKKLYLNNTFLLLEYDGTNYYLNNYQYLKSNDLNSLDNLIIEGIIDEISTE